MMIHSPRGFTLLIAVILTSVLLSVGLALLDISYKQVVLSSTARQSQYAFYAADSAIECALYWDQKMNTFGYGVGAGSIECGGQSIPVVSSTTNGVRTSTFNTPCINNVTASVTIYKTDGRSCGAGSATSCIYATGYNTCNASDPRRIERGLKVFY